MTAALARPPWSRVARTAILWLIALAAVSAFMVAMLTVRRIGLTITEQFVVEQDGVVAALFLVLAGLVALPAFRVPPGVAARLQAVAERRGLAICGAAAAAVAVIAFIGWGWVMQAYPLSMDEFWAAFDARVLQHGALAAPLAPAWRPYAEALQPMWQLGFPEHAWWASTYLPMNAAIRALCGLSGSQALAGPALAAASILLTYDLGRRLWPRRRDAAFIAALLLATSAQVIVIAMTPYAMSAHLALNLAWLALFLRKGAAAQAGAMAAAFVATGLHQWLFHPLFAAPFILQLWLRRRWRMAALWTGAYAVIVCFWIAWPTLLLTAHGDSLNGALDAQRNGAVGYALANAFNPGGLDTMAENLLRLTTWQTLLALPLALIAIRAALRERAGPLYPMAAGLILVVVFLTLITPFQGHGWGYRYLHGYLGVICLLAADTWVRFTPDGATQQRAWAAMALATGAAVFICLPLRAWQAAVFTAPFARASAAIRGAGADIVIVDPTGMMYADDLVRNDPFLTNRPKVIHLYMLDPARISALCAVRKVELFDARDGAAIGYPAGFKPSMVHVRPLEAAANRPPCGAHVIAR